MKKNYPTLSIVIPIFNESEIVAPLLNRLIYVFSKKNLIKNKIKKVNFIFVDDGSEDGSSSKILKYKKKLDVSLIKLSRNFGHQNAVFAGLENTNADLISVMDADLQDPPEVIFKMVNKWREGFQVVHAVRKNRKENFLLKLSFNFFYKLLNYLSDFKIIKDSGDFSLIDRQVLLSIINLSETNKNYRTLRSWVGFKSFCLEYDRARRDFGSSKYKIKNYINLAIDNITSASVKPLRLSRYFIYFYICIVFFMTVLVIYKYKNYLLLEKNLSNELALWSLSLFLVTFFNSAVICFILLIISIYLTKNYQEAKGRPSYIIAKKIK